MYFDSHAHYDSKAFNKDRDELLRSMQSRGVSHILNAGCDEGSSLRCITIAERYDFCYASVGWHPSDHAKWEGERSVAFLREYADHPKVVAIGEIGLDYYWAKEYAKEQKEMLHAQIAVAIEKDLPLIIHDREAHGDILEAVRRYDNIRGVFHCFSGSWDMAKELIDRGWYLGFDGPVTYKNAKKTVEVLEHCPISHVLIETDCPYLTPEPHRGERNDSTLLSYVVEKIADIKGLSAKQVADITRENACKLFGIDGK